MTITTAPAPAQSAWCNDHDGFDDGTEDWHRSRNVDVAGIEDGSAGHSGTGQASHSSGSQDHLRAARSVHPA